MRTRHPLEGRSLELIGWMRRGGRLDLIVVLPDGSRALIPAGWTDLEPPAEQPAAGALASLADLLEARLGQCPAPATALWGLLPEAERKAAAALVAKLIARTVAPEEVGGDE